MPFSYLSANVSSMKVLIADTIFKPPTGDGTAIGHPSHAKVSPLAVQREYVHFSVILRPWVMVRPWELNTGPPASNWETNDSSLPVKILNANLMLDLMNKILKKRSFAK